MSKYFLLLLMSCASYTDPEQERTFFYKCDRDQELVVQYSSDYGSCKLKHGDQQVLMQAYVTEKEVGFRNDTFRWKTEGRKGFLTEFMPNGSERPVFKNCKADKVGLRP